MFLGLIGASCRVANTQNKKGLKNIPEVYLGAFIDDYGSRYQISQTEWQHGAGAKYHLISYHQKDNYLIAQNDASNPSDANLYTRIDLIQLNNMEPWNWGYCLTVYKAASIKEAINSAAADKTNPKKGCNGFPFSRMKRD